MNDSVIRLRALTQEYVKIAAEPITSAKEKELRSEVLKKYPQLAEKKANFAGAVQTVQSGLRQAGQHLHQHEDAYELGGLGVLGAIGADRLQAHGRAGLGASNEAIEKKQMLGDTGHAALDTAGLGMLAAPLAAKKLLGH